MHFRRPLVLVVHDDPPTALVQANHLTRAGYRCLVSRDSATALWFAMRFALEAATLDTGPDRGGLHLRGELDSVAVHPGIVLLSPGPITAADLPENMVCLLTPAADSELVAAVERASRLRFARPLRTPLVPSLVRMPAPPAVRRNQADVVACS